jgi:FlaA1/EpsC-like NDP-sugar epimerase
LIAIDIDEYRVSKLNREMNLSKDNFKYTSYLLDVNNLYALSNLFKKHKPDIVYHAAASKHVDLVEKNWFFGSINNIESTFNICKCSNENNVEKTIFISTDKAVEPINFLGISKAVGEKFIKIFAKKYREKHFSTVRFGNVIGSSGSLLDIIKDQLKISNTINVTDKNMTRYFMTISDAVSLVLISTSLSNSGDCHVLKMGDPVKIIDVVNDIVKQKNIGNENNVKIKINYTGIRPGEKIHEKLFYSDSKIEKTTNRFISNENMVFKNEYNLNDFLDTQYICCLSC